MPKRSLIPLKLVIGLGNPGDKYINNRRNIGFRAIDVFANNMNIRIKAKKKKSLLGRGVFEDQEIVLLKPQTFAELSGEAVLYIASFLKISVKEIIIIHDDYTLPFGEVYLTRGPIESEHLGIQSIQVALKSTQFVRIRIGIGFKEQELAEEQRQKHLQADFTVQENMAVLETINDTEAALRALFTQDIDDVLSKYKLGFSLK